MAQIAVWRGGAEVTLETVELPVPGPGETLVEIDLATVCGSDLHTVSGRRPGACPSVLGHEGVGRIVGTGRRVVWGVTVSCGAVGRSAAYTTTSRGTWSRRSPSSPHRIVHGRSWSRSPSGSSASVTY